MAKLFVVAKAILINEKGEALILKRSFWPVHPERAHNPDLPGGLVERGESPLEATAREVKEETGITINEDALEMGYTKTFYDESDNESHTKFLYIGRLDHTPEVTLSFEHESYEWTLVADLVSTYKFGSFYAEGIAYLTTHKII